VVIGSYPFVSHPDFKTVITVEARLLPLDNYDVDKDRDTSGGDSGTSLQKHNHRSISTVYDRALLDEARLSKPGDTPGSTTVADAAVQLALDELIHSLPPGSVLRVESDDTPLFS
jgi:hypothetical protein